VWIGHSGVSSRRSGRVLPHRAVPSPGQVYPVRDHGRLGQQYGIEIRARGAHPAALAGCLNVNGGLLSARETDVVRCVAEGLTNREMPNV